MKVEKFTKEDMCAAISLAQHAWHGYYDGFPAEYIRCIAACIVLHNYTDADLAFKITDNGEMKGIIFGTRKGKIVGLSVWIQGIATHHNAGVPRNECPTDVSVDRHFVRPRLLPRPRLYLGFPIPRHALLYQRDRLYDLHLLETS